MKGSILSLLDVVLRRDVFVILWRLVNRDLALRRVELAFPVLKLFMFQLTIVLLVVRGVSFVS
jgi:hypothetical protein